MRASAASPALQRTSMRMFWPSLHPRWSSAWTNAARKDCETVSVATLFISTPMRFAEPGCCARAASGQTAALLSSVMNCRRRICCPVRHTLPQSECRVVQHSKVDRRLVEKVKMRRTRTEHIWSALAPESERWNGSNKIRTIRPFVAEGARNSGVHYLQAGTDGWSRAQ